MVCPQIVPRWQKTIVVCPQIVPRLLDWSEDVFVALHFALLRQLEDRAAYDDDWPTVWMIEAASLNKILQKNDVVFLTTAAGTDDWLPDQQGEMLARSARKQKNGPALLPVAILPPWLTPRIARQRGRFTVHGTEKKSLEKYFLSAKNKIRRGHIARIVITNPAQVASELRLLGFAKHHLFPEAVNLAAYLKEIAD